MQIKVTKCIQLETLACPSCVKKIESALNKQEGVKDANVLFNSSEVKADFDETRITIEQLEASITKLGYPLLSKKVS